MRVVADTSPLNYLALIGSVAILPALFATVLIPVGVERELADPSAPDEVRRLMRSAPPSDEVRAALAVGPTMSG